MFLNKYSTNAKIFACISVAVVFGLLAVRLIPIAPFLDHAVKGTAMIIGQSDECLKIQYYDSVGNSQSFCTTDIEDGEVGAQVEIWYVDSIPGTVLFHDPLVSLLACTVAGFGWFFTVLAMLWWNTNRLEKWATTQGITLMRISFVPPWDNPLGQRFRIDVIFRTYKVYGIDKLGREYEAWIRFKPFFLPIAKPRVIWVDDNAPGSKPKEIKEQTPESTLPSGDLADTIAKRKGERAPTRNAQSELLF